MEQNAGSQLSEYLAITRRGGEIFWVRAKKWFLVAALVGLMTGLAVTGLERAIALIWEHASSNINPVTVVLFPALGVFLSGLCLQYLTVNPEIMGTEEVIEAFHERGGVFRFRSFPGKVLASIATLGLGGSAGLEGPSIYIGGSIGAFALRKMRRLGFTDEDVRTLMIAGAAAGVAAIFKAPLTGIIFALEVPYKDDITREALIPSLVASVTAYFVLVQFLGVQPLFHVAERYTMSAIDLVYSAILGALIGLLARIFVKAFHWFEHKAKTSKLPLWARTGIGGLVTGAFGLASLQLFGEPVVLGPGYETITHLIGGSYLPSEAFVLLFLKAGAVTATLASGAAGGIFIPMIVLGADAGVMFQGLFPGAHGPLLPVVGMAAFLAAAYNTPIAATVFVAETTGGAGYIIPGLVAAAVAFTVAGNVSISTNQRWRRESRFDRLMSLSVADIMTHDVDTIASDCSVEKFVTDHLVHMRHKSMPVLDEDDRFVGVVAISDVGHIPREDWAELKVADVMVTDVLVTNRDLLVGDLAAIMAQNDVDRMPVVDSEDPTQLVGIVSSTDVMNLDDVCTDWRTRRKNQETG